MSLVRNPPGRLDRRFFVPDLTPQSHPEWKGFQPRWVFVAESPHLNEVEPEALEDRRPLCGAAGKAWWGMLSRLVEGQPNEDVSLERFREFCVSQGIAVLNAVQYPLDPKITRRHAEADPMRTLGFSKLAGPQGYKKMKATDLVQSQIKSLQARLRHPMLATCPIHALGNDAEWFIAQALSADEFSLRVGERIPHPSAWWRQNGLFGRIAEEKLSRILVAQSQRPAGASKRA